MKVLITTDPEIPVPPQFYGGAERIAYNFICGLRDRGYEIVLIANKESDIEGLGTFYSWPADHSRGWKNNFKNSLKLLKVIKKENPDIIYSFSRIFYMYLSSLLTGKVFIKRYGRHISTKSTNAANLIMGKKIHYVALAHHMNKHIKHHQEKWHIIPNSINVEKFNDDEDVEKEHLMFLGRIEYIKGAREAVEIALATKTKLVIAGNIPDEHQEYFDKYIKPYLGNPLIEYVGPVDDEQKKYYLQRSNALLFPINLKTEAFGIVMIESLSCGTPVIGRNIAAVPEVIEDGVNGYVCDTVEEMCAAVGKLDKIDRKKVRELTVNRYSIEAVTDAHLKVFEKLNG